MGFQEKKKKTNKFMLNELSFLSDTDHLLTGERMRQEPDGVPDNEDKAESHLYGEQEREPA